MIALFAFMTGCSIVIAYYIGYDAGKKESIEFIDGYKKLQQGIHEQKQELVKEIVPDKSVKVIMHTMN